MGLLARVGADVTRLVLETVEGLVAEGALVGAGEVLARLVRLLRRVVQQRRHEADGGSGHVGAGQGGWAWWLRVDGLGRGGFRVEQVAKGGRGGWRGHVTEGGKLGEGDDGGRGYMYGCARRACGGRPRAAGPSVLARARICRSDQGAPAANEGRQRRLAARRGARVAEPYQESGPAHLRLAESEGVLRMATPMLPGCALRACGRAGGSQAWAQGGRNVRVQRAWRNLPWPGAPGQRDDG